MRVITAADHRMKPWLERCVKAAEKFYPVTVYDLGGLGYGKPLTAPEGDLEWRKGYLPCLFKIDAISDALGGKEPILWLDADCILTQNVDELLKANPNVALALRKEGDVGAGHANTGVMVWWPFEETMILLDAWKQRAVNWQSEQRALNSLFPHQEGNETSLVNLPWMDCIVQASCRWLPWVYNDYYFEDGSRGAKVVHYKSDQRHRWPVETTKGKCNE
jgi:hypothetical protein